MRYGVDSPVARVQEPVLTAKNLKLLHLAIRAIPSGIHPKCFKTDFLLSDLIEKTKACRSLHPAPAQVRHRQNNRLSAVLRRVVLQDVPSQDIMCVDVITAPWEQQELRRPDLLTCTKNEMRLWHAGRHSNCFFGWAREGNGHVPGHPTEPIMPCPS